MTNSRILISLLVLSLLGSIMIAIIITNNYSVIFAQKGERYSFVRKWGSEGSADGQLLFPHSITLDSFGNVYVTDTGNNRVQKFAANGTFITKWGSKGSADGQFIKLHDITVDASGKFVYTVESSNSSAMFRDFLRIGAIAVVIILVGYLIYHNIMRRSKFKKAKS